MAYTHGTCVIHGLRPHQWWFVIFGGQCLVCGAQSADAGHSAPTFLNREFGYQIAADQLFRLRIVMTLVTFIVPLGLVYWVSGGAVRIELLGLAWVIMMAGLLLERWLFFAEARHVVRLYQGEQRT